MFDVEQSIFALKQWLEWIAEDYRTTQLRVRRVISDQSGNTFWTSDETQAARHGVQSRKAQRNPTLEILLHRAAWSLFDWLGVDRVPKTYWTLLGASGDPGDALRSFASALRINPLGLQNQSKEEVNNFRTVVMLLSQADLNPRALTNDMRFRLEAIAMQGAAHRLAELLRVLTLLNDAAETYALATRIKWFHHHAQLAQRVQALRYYPNRVSVKDATYISRQSDGWQETVFSYGDALRRITTLRKTKADGETGLLDKLTAELQDAQQDELEKVTLRLLAVQQNLDEIENIERFQVPRLALAASTSTEALLYDNATRQFEMRPEQTLSVDDIQSRFRADVVDRYPYSDRSDYQECAFNYRSAFRHRNALTELARQPSVSN